MKNFWKKCGKTFLNSGSLIFLIAFWLFLGKLFPSDASSERPRLYEALNPSREGVIIDLVKLMGITPEQARKAGELTIWPDKADLDMGKTHLPIEQHRIMPVQAGQLSLPQKDGIARSATSVIFVDNRLASITVSLFPYASLPLKCLLTPQDSLKPFGLDTMGFQLEKVICTGTDMADPKNHVKMESTDLEVIEKIREATKFWSRPNVSLSFVFKETNGYRCSTTYVNGSLYCFLELAKYPCLFPPANYTLKINHDPY